MKFEPREDGDERRYELEERTFRFAFAIRKCLADVGWTPVEWKEVNLLLRASGAIAANFSEASNTIAKHAYLHRIAMAKKHASESMAWLRLLASTSGQAKTIRQLKTLHTECAELSRILAAILREAQD